MHATQLKKKKAMNSKKSKVGGYMGGPGGKKGKGKMIVMLSSQIENSYGNLPEDFFFGLFSRQGFSVALGPVLELAPEQVIKMLS